MANKQIEDVRTAGQVGSSLQAVVTITANDADRALLGSLGDALKFMAETAAKVLKPGYATELNGVSREFRSSSGALGLVFALRLTAVWP